jgi:Pyruvate/2-oxoacid:ferredoxin oxidoreductase delta subunit
MSSRSTTSFPIIDVDRCTDCRECISVCSRNAIFEPLNICCAKCMKYCMTLEVECKREKPAIGIDRCDGCGLCIPACPAGAITWSAVEQPGARLARNRR